MLEGGRREQTCSKNLTRPSLIIHTFYYMDHDTYFYKPFLIYHIILDAFSQLRLQSAHHQLLSHVVTVH